MCCCVVGDCDLFVLVGCVGDELVEFVVFVCDGVGGDCGGRFVGFGDGCVLGVVVGVCWWGWFGGYWCGFVYVCGDYWWCGVVVVVGLV